MRVQVIRGALPDLSVLPEEVQPKGLDLERQWYLYEKTRPLCHSNLARDTTCPKPLQPKPGSKTIELPTSSACHSKQSGQSSSS